MSYHIRPFHENDLDLIDVQPRQAGDLRFARAVNWQDYPNHGFALTALRGESVVGIGGVVNIFDGVGECWMLISGNSRHRDMIRLVRSVDRVLHSELKTAYHRLQMYVEADFGPAVRMARLLGMEQEGLLKDYPFKGTESFLYARRNGSH